MIGMWALAGAGQQAFTIDNSLLFDSGSSSYLTTTPGTAQDSSTNATLSVWFKLGDISNDGHIMFAGNNTSNYFAIRYVSNLLGIYIITSSVVRVQLETTQVFRDPSAWYHLVISMDTTDSTNTERVKVYINGERITDFTSPTYAPSSQGVVLNAQSVAHDIGRRHYDTSRYWDGYMAEYIVVDGTTVAPTSFGEFDSTTGAWVPIEYTGSYGTNGFHLNFSNSSSLGEDSSGNGNNFSATNLTSSEQVTDSPTNNLCVFNILVPNTNATFSYGNLIAGQTAISGINNMFGTFGLTSGKWHWEITTGGSGGSANGFGVGISRVFDGTSNATTVDGFKFYDSGAGDFRNDGSNSAYGATYTSGDRITVELDIDNETLEFFKNGTSQGSIDLTGELIGYTWYPLVTDRTNTASMQYTANFGQYTFTDTASSGFNAVSNNNLLTPTIIMPTDYFNSVLYNGTGSSQSITGVGFQPDFVIVKSRSNATSNYVYDAVRGAGNRIVTDATATETSISGVTAFNSDGFTVGTEAGNNGSGRTFVGWCWKANGSGSSNTDGTITSTVSADTAAGISVVEYTGNATAGSTIGHGLGVAPDVIAIKALQDLTNWYVYYSVLGEAQRMGWNTTAAAASDTNFLNNTAPTSSVFEVGGGGVGTNYSGHSHVAYCFAEVEGFSKFGTYTGNGSTDGPFIYTGFKPAYVVVKRTNSTSSWFIKDNKRNPYNVTDATLLTNSTNAEATSNAIDVVSNGFKIRNSDTSNLNGSTFIFMAFAEYPFKYGLAR